MDKVYENMTLNHLRDILKEEIKNTTLNDLYDMSYQFQDDTKYLPEKYKQHYQENILNTIIKRFKLLKEDQKNYDGKLEENDVKLIDELLARKVTDITSYIYNILAIYTRYCLKQPIHMPNTMFFKNEIVYKKEKHYYCNIKKYYINNKNAICKYCIAKIPYELKKR